MSKKTALVAGALGIVGRNMIEYLLGLGSWNVIGLSRRQSSFAGSYRHLAVDLLDRATCQIKCAELRDITHVFFAARAPHPDPVAEADMNQAMLANLLESIEPNNPSLMHVNLVHGSKWYGSQFGRYKTPTREDDPRGFGRNFYFDQQDYIEARQIGKSWSWSTVRPHGVYGFSVGYPHNIMAVLALYALISRELGLPLRYPGNAEAFAALSQATDVDLLAKSMAWVATTPACANQAFNVGNGDNFRWENVWARVAAFFSMKPGPVQQVKLGQLMPGMESVWNSIVTREALQPYPYRELASWTYGDRIFSVGWDNIYSLTKIRNTGFLEFVDSEDMIIRHLESFRSHGVIP